MPKVTILDVTEDTNDETFTVIAQVEGANRPYTIRTPVWAGKDGIIKEALRIHRFQSHEDQKLRPRLDMRGEHEGA